MELNVIREETRDNTDYIYFEGGEYEVREKNPDGSLLSSSRYDKDNFCWEKTTVDNGISTTVEYAKFRGKTFECKKITRNNDGTYETLEYYNDGTIKSTKIGDDLGNYEIKNNKNQIIAKQELLSEDHSVFTKYNDDGVIVQYKETDGDRFLNKLYDDHGNILSSNDSDEIITHYSYDDDGYLTKVVENNSIDESINTKNYKKNVISSEELKVKDRLIYDKNFNSNGSPIASTEYEYYPDGKLKYRINTVQDRDLEVKKGYYYDPNGNQTPINDIYKDGKVIVHIPEEMRSYYYDDEVNAIYVSSDSSSASYYGDGGVAFSDHSFYGSNRYDDEYANIILYPDGTSRIIHYKYGDSLDENDEPQLISLSDEFGKYKKDSNGHYSFYHNGNYYEYNSVGSLVKKEVNGIVYERDNSKLSQSVTKNGKTTYSKINHIEFDEETYNKIMRDLDSISSEYPVIISNKCKNCFDTINTFEDKFSASGLASVNNNALSSLETVNELKESINYSLLAYQGCENYLEKDLHILIDDLFDESEAKLSTFFKRNIDKWIIDYDNDGIKEYISDTDFGLLEYYVPLYDHEDEDGNTWYTNNYGEIISVKGENPKLKFGGEVFNVEMTSDGIIKLTDSEGNPLNIFGDYNLESCQYGGNQCSFYNKHYLIRDENIQKILNKRFDNCSTEEFQEYLSTIGETGCGYTALTNVVFKMFEGKEEEFNKTFGYPMYKIKYWGSEDVEIDYNYEPMIFDLYSEVNGRENNVTTTRINGEGITNVESYQMYQYLHNEYGIFTGNYNEDINMEKSGFFGDWDYNLYNLDGSLYLTNGGPHGMVKLGETEDGKWIVSTWGQKMLCEPCNPFGLTINEDLINNI